MKTLAACRKGTLPMPKTAAGAVYQYSVLYRQYRRAYAGGGAYGYDWNTMSVQEPEVYARMRHLFNTYPSVGR